MFLYNAAMWPFSKCGPPVRLFRDSRPTKAILHHWQRKLREQGSKRKEERINQARRKTKATGQGAQSVILPPLGVKRREGKKKKGSLEFTRGKFSFFSWTAECLIMGLDLTSVPLGMWNRGLVVMGGRVFGGWCGSGVRLRGGPGWGVGYNRVVVGRVREAVCGRAWQGAQVGGEATAQGPTWTLANSAITPHSEQLAHNGYSGTCSPSIGHPDPRSSTLACLSTTWQPEITSSGRCQGCHHHLIHTEVKHSIKNDLLCLFGNVKQK